jgi:DNA repair protein SbcD/Mre11
MSKKIAFITDTHFRDDRPKSRTDDVIETQFAKLGNIIQLVQDHDIDVMLHGGDFFNTKKPSHQLVVHLLEWCKSLGIPIYGAIGNHDITGYNLDSVTGSGLGVLLESNAIERLDFKVFPEEKIVIKSVHCSLNFEQDYLFPSEYDSYFKLIVSHNYVIPSDSMPFGFIHPKDINTNAHLVLCGHYHVPFDYDDGKTRWVNPGPLFRWSVSEKSHTPKLLMLTVDGLQYKLDFLTLSSVKPSAEVFDLSLLDKEKQQERDIKEFVKNLSSVSFQNVDIENLVKERGAIENIDKSILDVVLAKIRNAKEILS